LAQVADTIDSSPTAGSGGRAVPDLASYGLSYARIMSYFLVKTHPDTYSVEDFRREGTTTWNGVTNAQAVATIRTMRPGDGILVYHSGGHSAIVGLAEVISKPVQDAENQKSWVVDLRFRSLLSEPAPLSEIKATGLFNNWALVRQGRLSAMPVPDDFLAWLRVRYPLEKL